MVELRNGKIYIDHADVLKLGKTFKSYFKFAKMKNMKWEITATYPNVEAVNRLFKVDLRIEEPENTVDVTKYLTEIDYKFKRDPFKHQLEALANCNGREAYAYFLEPGLGKTKVAIDDAMILHKQRKIDTVLVICPISAISVWEDELQKNADGISFSSWPKTPPNFGMCFYIINHDVLVSNYINNTKYAKKLETTHDQEKIEEIVNKIKQIEANVEDGFSVASLFLMSSSKCMIIIDESTCIANWQSLRTIFCTKLGLLAGYKRILTGDPIPNNPIDLYSQLYWLDPTIVGNRSYYAFRGHFCNMGGYKNKQIESYRNIDELTAICKRHGYRARSEDVLDMPEQNWLIRRVIPNQSTIDLYNKIVEEDIVSYLDNYNNEAFINVNMMLTQFIKLQQVCGGTLIDNDGQSHIVGTEKLKELMMMLDEWRNIKTLVWHQFKEEGKMITEALTKKGKSVALFNGDLSASERGDMVREFEKGNVDHLVVQNDAGHLSITLNKATYAVWYSNHLRPIVRSQSERRNWRIGQKNPVFYYDLLMDGFIDSWVYKRLRRKRNFNADITDAGMTKKNIMDAIYDKE
jgi:SNF2 family DNA or RNA helicase